MDWLRDIPLLLSAAREGSATKAAEALGISTATAIRRLDALEEALGASLFIRSPQGLVPTEALALVLPWAEQLEAVALSLHSVLDQRGETLEGLVKVASVETLASWFIAPALPTLLDAYPGLVVEVVTGPAVVDLVRREADIAVRLVKPDGDDLIVKHLGDAALAIVGAPGLAERSGAAVLGDLPWIGWGSDQGDLPEARWLKHVVPGARVVFRTTNLNAALQAAKAGVGALLTAAPLAQRVGGLVRVGLPTPALPKASVWLVTHKALRRVPKISAVWDFLIRTFQNLSDP